MVNKRLISFNRQAIKYVWLNVMLQWIALLCNIAFVCSLASVMRMLFLEEFMTAQLAGPAAVCLGSVLLRFVCTTQAAKMSQQSSSEVKGRLRNLIYQKMLKLGSVQSQDFSTSQIVMLASEGVEQLDVYFSRYLPQLFYSLLAPLTLFVLLAPIYLPSALILLFCVPLIPASIVAVQKLAKKLLSRYWNEYTTLGDSFLENLQGLTTLKIYKADEYKNKEMNVQAERFRKITMKVLTMQLNSVTLMDLVAYGGAALGIVSAVAAFSAGKLPLYACFMIVLLAADFFLPLRLLGSYFHIAMNGSASAEKIFKLLDLPETKEGNESLEGCALQFKMEHVSFQYERDRTILDNVSLQLPEGSFTAIVGESGCGKSTIAAILSGKFPAAKGTVTLGGVPLQKLSRKSLLEAVTLVPHDAIIFKGTVKTNLFMGNAEATDEVLWDALKRVNLAAFFQTLSGLDTALSEGGGNLSGGQRQRLAMARALLRDSAVYIFDEATSNIDAESENDIMRVVSSLSGKKTILLISHRLYNVVNSDNIYVLQNGKLAESGGHAALMKIGGVYYRLFTTQEKLEQRGGVSNETK